LGFSLRTPCGDDRWRRELVDPLGATLDALERLRVPKSPQPITLACSRHALRVDVELAVQRLTDHIEISRERTLGVPRCT